MFFKLIINCLSNIAVHKYKVANASAHYEKMKYFMGAEIFMKRIKNRKLQGINHAADGIDDAACKKPAKRSMGKRVPKRSKYQKANPSHSNVNCGRKPFRTGNPNHIDEHSGDGNAPYKGKQGIPHTSAKHDQAYGSVGTGNQYKYHHMVNFAKHAEDFSCDIDTVI